MRLEATHLRTLVAAAPPIPSVLTTGFNQPRVRFAVLEVIKGRLATTSSFETAGLIFARDDPNEGPVPYTSPRSSGIKGNCHADEYRIGGEYLLLRQRQPNPELARRELTPYWAALRPTSEQLFGGTKDPWYVWVKTEVRRSISGKPRPSM